MKIPTPEMWNAFEQASGVRLAFISFEKGVAAMLAATPLPLAQPCVAPYKSHECKDCGKVIEQTPPAGADGYVTNCVIIPRDNEQLFPIKNGRRVCNIDRYAIIPLEQYETLKTPPAQDDEPHCPRPCNGRPDDLTMAECILAGECGCTVKGHEYAQSKAQDVEPAAWADKHGRVIARRARTDGVVADQYNIPLYTRPDNIELRKAALTVLEIARENKCVPYALYQNLRAALNKGK